MKAHLLFNLFVVPFLFFYSNTIAQDSTSASCTRRVNFISATECAVEITLRNITTNGIAKLTEEIPKGYIADSLTTLSSSFSFEDNMVKFIFVSFPKKKEIKLSYKLKGPNIKNVRIKGSFVFINGNRKVTLKVKEDSDKIPTGLKPDDKKRNALLTINSELLSYSVLSSLLDDGINILIKKTASVTQNDIDYLISQYKERVIVYGYGFSYNELNGFMNAGSKIVLNRSFSAFDIRQLVQIGREKVIIDGNGLDNFDLENYLSFNSSVILGREQWGNALSLTEKYKSNILFNNPDFSITEISNYMKMGAGVWVNTEDPAVFDLRFFLELSATYGGSVFVASKMSYIDILNLWKQ